MSEIVRDAELTYQIYLDDATSVDNYQVRVPLFQDQIVTAPSTIPTAARGRSFPSAATGRASVARVRVRSRSGSRAPRLARRGEGAARRTGATLFLGKTGKNNTSVLHDYQAEKPVFRILRTNQSDTSFFKLEEGKLTPESKR